MRQSTDKRLTLITCYPTYHVGPAPDRLAVFAKLTDSQGASADVQAAAKKPAGSQ